MMPDTIGSWVRAALAVAKRLPAWLWAAAALMLGVSNYLSWPLAGVSIGVALAVQAVLTLILTYWVLRAGAGVMPVAEPGMPLLRFGGVGLATMLVVVSCYVVGLLLLPDAARLADLWLTEFGVTMLASVLLLPLAPWLTALAIGDRTMGPGEGWRRLRARFRAFAGAYLALVGPFTAIWIMLSMLLEDPASLLRGNALVGVVFVATLASLGATIFSAALAVAAWQLREGERAR